MAKQNQRGGATAAEPTPTPALDEDLLEADERDEDAPTSARPREDETESLLAAAKRHLGLPAEADALDILRAVVKRGPQRYAGPPRAACRMVVVVNGARQVIEPGALIPAGVDVSKLPADAIEGGS